MSKLPKRLSFNREPIPIESKQSIVDRGGRPVMACVHKDGRVCVAVIVSLDPSGEGGSWECHASITASLCGRFIKPRRVWISQVENMLGMRPYSLQIPFDSNLKGVHVFSDLWKKGIGGLTGGAE